MQRAVVVLRRLDRDALVGRRGDVEREVVDHRQAVTGGEDQLLGSGIAVCGHVVLVAQAVGQLLREVVEVGQPVPWQAGRADQAVRMGRWRRRARRE